MPPVHEVCQISYLIRPFSTVQLSTLLLNVSLSYYTHPSIHSSSLLLILDECICSLLASALPHATIVIRVHYLLWFPSLLSCSYSTEKTKSKGNGRDSRERFLTSFPHQDHRTTRWPSFFFFVFVFVRRLVPHWSNRVASK